MRSIGYGEVPVWGSCSDPLMDPRSNPSPAEVGFPDFGQLKSAELGKPRVRWGGEHTECAA
jgi:hypothetical protein